MSHLEVKNRLKVKLQETSSNKEILGHEMDGVLEKYERAKQVAFDKDAHPRVRRHARHFVAYWAIELKQINENKNNDVVLDMKRFSHNSK